MIKFWFLCQEINLRAHTEKDTFRTFEIIDLKGILVFVGDNCFHELFRFSYLKIGFHVLNKIHSVQSYHEKLTEFQFSYKVQAQKLTHTPGLVVT